jgi:hypothetical protein
MSLVQHVSALEGVDFEPDPDIDEDFVPIARKISYDVLHPTSAASAVEAAPPATPAYKHSTLKRGGTYRTSFCRGEIANFVQRKWHLPFSRAGSRPESCLDSPR